MRSKEKEWNLVSVGNPVAHMMSCSCILDILGICVLETVKFLSLMFSSGVVARCILSFLSWILTPCYSLLNCIVEITKANVNRKSILIY